MSISVTGTLPAPRTSVRHGDHAAYDGVYVGLIVDIMPEHDSCMVACRSSSGKVTESTFRLSALRVAAPRK